MTKRTIVANLAKQIGELEVDGKTYPLLAPNGWVVQAIEAAEAAGGRVKVSDGYDLVGKCVPSMPHEVLMAIGADDIARILEEIKEALLGTTKEVLPEGPKPETAATS